MQLQWIELVNFRSYERLDFVPADGVNVLVGANGSGKTSLLEGIGYLSVLRSLRGTPDDSLIRESTPETVLRGSFLRSANEVTVEAVLPQEGRRRVLLNGKRPRRYSEVTASVAVVWFLGDDIDLVKRGPGLRRQFLDDLAAQLRPGAGRDRSEYERVLRQRNALLRQSGHYAESATLDALDEQLGVLGTRIYEERRETMRLLKGPTRQAISQVAPGTEVHWRYRARWLDEGRESGHPAVTQALLAALTRSRARDMAQRATTAGPHRDNPDLLIGDRSLRRQASQGEQRSAAIGLRVAAYGLLEQELGEPPILLLDDVFSELDAARVNGVSTLIPRGQVFVTTTREDEVPVEGKRWRVGEGTIA